MGYETKLIIGRTYPNNIIPSDNGMAYVTKLAMIDLSGSIFTDTFIDDEDKETPTFFYSDSQKCSDEKILTDCYGKQLYAIDPVKVLGIMKKAHKRQYYRRYAAAIPMLESLIKDFEHEHLKCILFGH